MGKKKKEADYYISAKYLDEALRMINKGYKPKVHRLDKFPRERKLKIQHFCSFDVNMDSAHGTYKDKYPTDTQSLLLQIRRSVSEHDWSTLARCVDFALNLSGKLMPVIWKSCFLVLFNHPESSPKKLDDFLQLGLGLMRHSEKEQFLENLLTLPSSVDDKKKRKK